MAKLRQTDFQVGRRAGVSLARAQRLAGKTSSAGTTPSRVYVSLGILAIGGFVGYGLYASENTSEHPILQAGAAEVTEAPVSGSAPNALALALSTPPAMADTSSEPLPSPELQPIEEALEVADTPDSPIPADSEVVVALPDCVQSIEDKVASLRSATSGDDAWAAQQGNVAALVQATLDCSHAQLEIAGSLELLGTDLADLRISWDREDWNLDLAMIDGLGQLEAGPDPASDATTIQFVIR